MPHVSLARPDEVPDWRRRLRGVLIPSTGTRTKTLIVRPEGVRIPVRALIDFEAFRAWTRSPDFPEKGRIDYLAGKVHIDMAAEDLSAHGTPRSRSRPSWPFLVGDSGRGLVYSDCARIVCPPVRLSVEPDGVVVLNETIASGRVRGVPGSGRRKRRGRYIELEGTVDLVVECLSDSSIAKDTEDLFKLYHAAGIPEYWLVDAREHPAAFTIYRWAPRSYRKVSTRRDGYTPSPLLGRAFRLIPSQPVPGYHWFRLDDC